MKQRILIALSGILFVYLMWMGLKPTSTEATETCPDGGAWQKDETAHNGFDETCYGGKKVSQICIKGGTNVKYFTTNGNDGCWARSGIGTSVGEAWKIGHGSSCKDISHASFKCETVSPTPTVTPTNTPVPTPTPSPTPTPTKIPEPTPTEIPEPTPTEVPEPTPTEIPEPTPTNEPEVTPEPTDKPEVTPEPTDEPEVTPEPTQGPGATPTPTTEVGRGGYVDDNKDSNLEITEVSCTDNKFTATMTLKENDVTRENVKVRFQYKDEVHEALTNYQGKASVMFTFVGNGEVKAEADGFETRTQEAKGPENCGQVLGISTYAGTGTPYAILGLYTSGLSMLAGSAYTYARSKKQK